MEMDMTDLKPGDLEAGITDADYKEGFEVYYDGFRDGYKFALNYYREHVVLQLAKIPTHVQSVFLETLKSLELEDLADGNVDLEFQDHRDEDIFSSWCNYLVARKLK
jgi:hypothetical protein